MMRLGLFVLFLASFVHENVAFAVVNHQRPAAFVVAAQQRSPLQMGLAQPDIKIGTKVETKQKQKVETKRKVQTGDPIAKRKEKFEDAPLYKVMLIGDDAYDSGHVIDRMCAIMEDMDEDQASTVFEQAQMAGKAMCGKYPLEHAEMYKEQLLRSDPMIFADLEDENK
jgi:ATP-dependent Clp protease adapter protein ClpS